MSSDTPAEQAIKELEAGLAVTSAEAEDEHIENSIKVLEDVLF